ncbi:MAG TPA: hypothetical protein VK715_01475 [Steroidobacteraceae bacterium]|nr:hypothetical protein [Steroidobacteraceae bacterium]
MKWVSWALWALTAATAATAGPPQGSRAEMFTRSAARAESPAASRLDLRAPVNYPLPAAGPPAFPSARRASGDAERRGLREDFPSLASDLPAMRTMSRAEEIAHRFRHEGLPVARLFESRSALVSLGLNQRGKPGIWLIQKLP